MKKIMRFFNTVVPTNRCNLRCHYCYVGQNPSMHKNIEDERLKFPIEHISKALSPERLGGCCMFNLCAAGETLLHEDINEVVSALLDTGHFVAIVTNATITGKLRELVLNNLQHRDSLFIKCSLQYLELKRLNLTDTFFDNVSFIKENGISFSVEMTANDDAIPYIQEIKDVCMRRMDALCNIIESRNEGDEKYLRLTNLPLSEHQKAWSEFNSPLFNYQQKTYEKPVKEYCYAGDYSLLLDLRTGNMSPCNLPVSTDNLFDEITHIPNYIAVGRNCTLYHCFIRYAHSLLCGCFNDENAVSYADIRDKICSDGTSWLTPVVSDTFSCKINQWHSPYDKERTLFFDCLMRKLLKNEDSSPSELKDLSVAVERSLKNRGIDSVAIYGYGNLGRWLCSILNNTNLKLRFIIDKHEVHTDNNIPIYTPEMMLPEADVIVISILAEYGIIANQLSSRTNAGIMSIINMC